MRVGGLHPTGPDTGFVVCEVSVIGVRLRELGRGLRLLLVFQLSGVAVRYFRLERVQLRRTVTLNP